MTVGELSIRLRSQPSRVAEGVRLLREAHLRLRALERQPGALGNLPQDVEVRLLVAADASGRGQGAEHTLPDPGAGR